MRALIEGLPPRGAVHRAVDPDGWSWSTLEELVAIVAEVVDSGNRLFFSANSGKGAKIPSPIRIARPGRPTARHEEPEKKKKVSHTDVTAFFQRAGR